MDVLVLNHALSATADRTKGVRYVKKSFKAYLPIGYTQQFDLL